MDKGKSPVCAKCPTKACDPRINAAEEPALADAPVFCPMKNMPEVGDKAEAEYENPEVKEFARLASIQEFKCYETLPEGRRAENPRILELIQFAQ